MQPHHEGACTLKSTPQPTLQPHILYPTPCTLHPLLYTLHPTPYTPNPQPSTLNPQLSTLRQATQGRMAQSDSRAQERVVESIRGPHGDDPQHIRTLPASSEVYTNAPSFIYEHFQTCIRTLPALCTSASSLIYERSPNIRTRPTSSQIGPEPPAPEPSSLQSTAS